MPKEGTDFGATGEKDDFTSIEIALTVDEVVKMSFSYIFASRELPEFGGTDYNDAFFLNINGENLAKLPDGKVCLFVCLFPSPAESAQLLVRTVHAQPRRTVRRTAL